MRPKKLAVLISTLLCAFGFRIGADAASVPASAAPAPRASADTLTPDERVNIDVYKKANKAVVYITTTTQTQDMFFRVVPSQGEGSGCILTSDGYILTNYHVVKDARFVNVTFWDGTTLPAEITGVDPDYDVAVIKVNPGRKVLQVTQLGDSSKLEVGRRVFVIGNPFGFDRTMTQGIVSMIGRNLNSVGGRVIKGIIQTDAPVNPGNSGGPLLNTRGEMIGLTTAIYSRLESSSAQWAGIGFAIPINTVKGIFPELIAHHRVVRPDIGIKAVRPIQTKEFAGLMVLAVEPDGPAAAAGLQGLKVRVTQNGPFTIQQIDADSADILLKIDEVATKTTDDLLSYIEKKKAGQVVNLTVWRNGKLLKIPLKLSSGS
jgi:S1-C subfamily serine protease